MEERSSIPLIGFFEPSAGKDRAWSAAPMMTPEELRAAIFAGPAPHGGLYGCSRSPCIFCMSAPPKAPGDPDPVETWLAYLQYLEQDPPAAGKGPADK
jgi:hypothetical protein